MSTPLRPKVSTSSRPPDTSESPAEVIALLQEASHLIRVTSQPAICKDITSNLVNWLLTAQPDKESEPPRHMGGHEYERQSKPRRRRHRASCRGAGKDERQISRRRQECRTQHAGSSQQAEQSNDRAHPDAENSYRRGEVADAGGARVATQHFSPPLPGLIHLSGQRPKAGPWSVGDPQVG